MKKITAVLAAALLCLSSVFALVSCSNTPATTTADTTKAAESTPETTKEAATTEEVTTEATTTEEVTTEAATTEAKTTEGNPGVNYVEDEMMLFDRRAGDSHDPISADSGKELACKFTLPEGARLTGLYFESCPTWSTPDYSGFVVELYKWDNDYENTLVGEMLYSEEFEEWVDNAYCELDFTDKAPSGFETGTYLWVFRGTTDKIGIWAMDPIDECEYFENGVSANHGFQVLAYILTPA